MIKSRLEGDARSATDLSAKDFLVAKKDKKTVGFARLFKLTEKISTLASLWVAPEERGNRLGYLLMEKLFERSKLKRFYIDTSSELESYFAEFGFIHLKEAPEALAAARGQAMVYDKTKRRADPSFMSRPDLIIVDGGKPQLSAALEARAKYDLDIPIIALAKRLEEVYLPGKSAPFLFEEGEEALKLLQRIRDEAHRFAITFQRETHRKTIYK